MLDKSMLARFHSRTKSLAILIAMAACTLVGCGGGGDAPTMGKVSGKVLYADGSIPKEGMIWFEPAPGSKAVIRKPASGFIEEDGSYEMTTVKPGDGVILGDYKIVFTLQTSYRDGISLVDAKYTDTSTTPLERTVDSSSHTYDFEIEKSKAGKK